MIAQLDKDYILTKPLKVWSRLISYTLLEGRPLTTKGRWINPAVFAFLNTLAVTPQIRKVEKPIFILGTGRSGSTILGKVLSMHKDLAFLNEPKAIWATLRRDEDLIGSYNLDTESRYRLNSTDVTDQVRQKATRIFSGALLFTGQKRFVDKYPELIFRNTFVDAIFPDAKHLFLSRNVDSTCSSISHWSERKATSNESQTEDWWGVNNRKWDALVNQLVVEHDDLLEHRDRIDELSEEGRAAVEWVVTMREGIQLCRQNPERYMHVPYDMLCEDSGTWTENLCQFLELNTDATFNEYARRTLTEPARHPKIELPDWLRTITDRVTEDLADLQANRLPRV